ncbi:hypothetical protein [Haloplanus halophilus]|uniref:hypothetical protein n=1 Tax=Haloplanus halophilus TaxID=2949993 RepID=UPI0020401F48|nr:hypothetical protein [Haloplanus sp. GDY1]
MTDEPEYLYVVDYADDAERKRVEYLFNNWSGGEIDRPEGVVRLTSDVDHERLYEQLVSKVPEERIRAYRLEEGRREVSPTTRTVERTVPTDADAVETFVQYMLSKKKAVLQSPAHNEYEMYTKKGRATATYELDEDGDGTTVRVRITGYADAPAFLAEFFESELTDYAASQRS